ncbi:MAG: hypothetical protein ABR915_04190 [Thermoguttaceae bacterium]
MEWLISEVFAPAKAIGDALAQAPPDKVSKVFHCCILLLAQMEKGLKRADQEIDSFPADVAAEIRNL